MRLLFVGPGGSIHTARWISQLAGTGWQLFLFPTELFHIREEMPPLVLLDVENPEVFKAARNIDIKDRFYSAWGRCFPLVVGRYKASQFVEWCVPHFKDSAWRLARVIDRLQPDIVHSFGLHMGGYSVLNAREFCKKPFPIWVASNWGSDLFLFGRLEAHQHRLKDVLASIDYYWCECQRDVELAKSQGVPRDRILPIIPVSGGFDIQTARGLRQAGPVSARKVIMVKGYQDWAGRGLVALYALRLCRDLLGGYEIAIFTGGRDPEAVHIAGELLSQDIGVPVTFIAPRTPHRAMLQWHGRARISIGLSISDSIAISLLEAMLMGSFPIQSNTGAADEWIIDGRTGFIVPPEDPYAVADSLRRALTDDSLVDSAAEINFETICERCDGRRLSSFVRDIYRAILERRPFDSVQVTAKGGFMEAPRPR